MSEVHPAMPLPAVGMGMGIGVMLGEVKSERDNKVKSFSPSGVSRHVDLASIQILSAKSPAALPQTET